MAESQLKPILTYMGAHVIQKYVYIQDQDYEENVIINTDIQNRIHTLALDIIDGLNHLDLHNEFMNKRKTKA